MSIILCHPTSNANNRAVAQGLFESKTLQAFYTTIAIFPGGLLDHFSALGLFPDLQRRRFDSSLCHLTKAWPWVELSRQIAQRVGLRGLNKHESGPFSIDAVYQSLDKRVARSLKYTSRRGATAIYAYEDGAINSFSEAKVLGLKCLYDLPIGYWRAAHRLLACERERWPEWSSTLTGFNDSERKLAQKDAELQLADRIFVASQFTAKTLQDFPGALAPIKIIPYGYPPVFTGRDYVSTTSKSALKVLFVGGLSQRKGIADLLKVVESLKPYVELTIVGNKVTDNCPVLDAALVTHKWVPSLPHSDILKLMHVHDVLVLPSLFEGFGLVITEAMSQGTPVITTNRTAGPDLIEQDYNGWLIEAGSSDALQYAIEKILSKRRLVIEAGKAAMESARLRPWYVYGRELVEAICEE